MAMGLCPAASHLHSQVHGAASMHAQRPLSVPLPREHQVSLHAPSHTGSHQVIEGLERGERGVQDGERGDG